VKPPIVEADSDPRLLSLVKELFQPVVRDYALVSQHVRDSWRPRQSSSPSAMVKEHPSAYLLHLEDAFSALADRGVLVEQARGEYRMVEAGGAEG
jgi:3-hydroxy-3-methylglutaryl CoA synthase